MKYFIVDVSGKVVLYDIALCEAIAETYYNDLKFYCPLYSEKPHCKTIRLFNLVPKRYKNGEFLWKRALKVIELVFNYIFIIICFALERPDVVHFQWLPLLEACSGEHLVLQIMRLFSRHTQMILTIHNVYPHSFSDEKKNAYAERFKRIASLIDAFIVHTEATKTEVVQEFYIAEEKINVVHHGIFTPSHFIPRKNKGHEKELRLIMYGNLSDYKGVDIFVEAIKKLPASYQNRVRGVIAGEMQNKVLCKKLQEDSKGLNIDWYPYFLPEQELYKRIEDSNVIVLPYRHISQSGVLLLALYFRRYIITSDLPTFRETLHGFTDDMFFESENSSSLARLIMKYVDGIIDTEKQMSIIDGLCDQYSWKQAAEKTVNIYRKQLRDVLKIN